MTSVAVQAEVSAMTQNDAAPKTLMMSVSEGPDPVDSKVWTLYHVGPSYDVLNMHGYLRGDGRPDIDYLADSSPVVAWTWQNSSDGDIAVAQWSLEGWSHVSYLTSGAEDELDPRVAIDDLGTTHVVWWVADTEEVFISSRPAESTNWSIPLQITETGKGGRRPSVTCDEGVVRVLYERTGEAGVGQEVVAVPLDGQVVQPSIVLATISRHDRLDAILHSEAGVTWATWKFSDLEFAWSIREADGWTAFETEPWDDETWVGAEDVRRTIRRLVLHRPAM